MNVKTKNILTALLLGLLALIAYLYALPPAVLASIGKALKGAF